MLKALFLAALAARGHAASNLIEGGRVAPDTLYLVVSDGSVEYGRQQDYLPQPGDEIDKSDRNHWLKRGGKLLGAVVGPQRNKFTPFDKVQGPSFDAESADKPLAWVLRSGGRSLNPDKVWRKSIAKEAGRVGPWEFKAALRHSFYLKFKALPQGKASLLGPGGFSFALDLSGLRQPSEAVHVSQLGFRPDDPLKVGFVSCWTGSGGALDYREGSAFALLDESGKAVFQGRLRLRLAKSAPEDAYKKNYSGAPVYEADFSAFGRPGRYRLCADEAGCSRPFDIDPASWARAFRVSARGFYHQRSGIALGPPYTSFVRPANFSPESGQKTYHSKTSLFESGNGPRDGIEKDNFGNLVKGGTDQLVETVWGGYHDAGDWDRRIQHLEVSRSLFELQELFPAWCGKFSLGIPESSNALPDVVDEALFNLDFYRRLQDRDGGVRGGIESAEHPNFGELSWQETLKVFAYAPDPWSSYVYAGVAARAAWLLPSLDQALARRYAESAKRAFAWAEQKWKLEKAPPIELRDARNLAAAELYRMDGAGAWHKIFLETTAFKSAGEMPFVWKKHDQEHAAWVYARSSQRPRDPQVHANARASLMAWAGHHERRSSQTGFGWTQFEYRPFGMGSMSSPDAVPLLRAHLLSGEEKYLKALILACQSGAGANPSNLCYTTGLGHQSPRHALHLDSRISGQAAPPGLTLLGPVDPEAMGGMDFEKVFGKFSSPPWQEWPRAEAFYDVFWYPPMNEFTVQLPMARNALIWGYLAARPKAGAGR